MIIGSGLLARAFATEFSGDEAVCIYCAGVSNSSCSDGDEFDRERRRLRQALELYSSSTAFVYFGTCSADDPDAVHTPYVQHKLRMERLVTEHARHLIVRLPQVVGVTPNPHTLLNFLYARISRSEAFTAWGNARRNVIDVDDVAAVVIQLIREPEMRGCTVNVANTRAYSVVEIIGALERVLGKKAVYDIVDKGNLYNIDTGVIRPILSRLQLQFDEQYIDRVVGKYYGQRRAPPSQISAEA